MQDRLPRLAAALATAWGIAGLVVLAGLLLGLALPSVDADPDRRWPGIPALHALGGVLLLAGLLAAPFERDASTAGLRAAGSVVAVGGAHIVALLGLMVVSYTLILGPLFGGAATPGPGEFLWVALTAGGGGWTGVLAGALVAPWGWARATTAAAAGAGLLAVGVRTGWLSSALVGPAHYRGDVLLVALAVAGGWALLLVGGVRAFRADEPHRRALALAAAALGGAWAGLGGVAAFARLARGVTAPLPPGVAGQWLPDPMLLSEAIVELALLLPLPLVLCAACGLGALAARHSA